MYCNSQDSIWIIWLYPESFEGDDVGAVVVVLRVPMRRVFWGSPESISGATAVRIPWTEILPKTNAMRQERLSAAKYDSLVRSTIWFPSGKTPDPKHSMQSNPTITDLKGLTIFFCYWWTSVIANVWKKKAISWDKKIGFIIGYRLWY